MKRFAQLMVTGSCAMALALGTLSACGKTAESEPADDEEQETVTQVVDLSGGEDEDEDAGESGTVASDTAVELPFSYDLPSYWIGQVDEANFLDDDGTGVVISLAGNPDAVLATLVYLPGDEADAMGDIANHCVGSFADGNGGHVEAWTTNWPWLAASDEAGELGFDDETLAQLVDLSTGGAVSLDQLRADGADAHMMDEADFSSNELAATVAFG